MTPKLAHVICDLATQLYLTKQAGVFSDAAKFIKEKVKGPGKLRASPGRGYHGEPLSLVEKAKDALKNKKDGGPGKLRAAPGRGYHGEPLSAAEKAKDALKNKKDGGPGKLRASPGRGYHGEPLSNAEKAKDALKNQKDKGPGKLRSAPGRGYHGEIVDESKVIKENPFKSRFPRVKGPPTTLAEKARAALKSVKNKVLGPGPERLPARRGVDLRYGR